ncbi:MAG: hypothetical protein R6X34_26195, partial [Chloroflexota bacterium]
AQLTTGLKYDGEFNDNIFYDPDNEESDFIHTITPSLELVYPGLCPGNFFKARYSVGIVRYNDFSDTDYEDHRFFAGFGFRSPAGFYVTADDFYQNTADPYGSENTYKEGDQTERWNNAINLTVGYDFADVYTVEVYGRNFMERYDLTADQYQDRNRNTVGGMLLYRLNRIQFLGELRRAAVTFDEQNDGIDGWDEDNSQDHAMTEALLGCRIQPGGKIVGELKVGYQSISFENDEDKNGNPYNDDPTFIVEADLSYFMSEQTAFNVFGRRNRNTSVTAGDSDDVSSSYISTQWGIGLTQKIMRQFELKIQFERGLEDYLDVSSGNDDKLLTVHTFSGSLNYDINQWLDAGLTASYRDKTSSSSQYEDDEYTVTRYGFYIQLTY